MSLSWIARWIGIAISITAVGCQTPPDQAELTKSVRYTASEGCATNDLADQWQRMFEEARAEAGVFIPNSSSGIFGGVHTMNPKVTFGQRDGQRVKGDAALALYHVCSGKFDAWANANGGRSSYVEGGGRKSLRVKASNGDYLATQYLAPSSVDGIGSIIVIFVDADEFDSAS